MASFSVNLNYFLYILVVHPRVCGAWLHLAPIVETWKIDQTGSDIDHLKAVLCRCWDMINEDLIASIIDQWSERVMMVIQVQGGRMKHRLK